MPNLLTRSSEFGLNTPLIRISAVCCVVGTNNMQMTHASNFLIKCLSISACLVRSCYTRLCAMSIVALLSQYNFIKASTGFFNSSKIWSHRISHTPLDIARYSASTLLRAMTFFFFFYFSKSQDFPKRTYNSLGQLPIHH